MPPVMSETEPHRQRARLLDLLLRTSRALGAEPDRPRLVEQTLMEARALAGADGGTLYLVDEHRSLRFAIMRNDTLKIREGGTAPTPCRLTPVPLFHPDGRENLDHLAARCYWKREAIAIDPQVFTPEEREGVQSEIDRRLGRGGR